MTQTRPKTMAVNFFFHFYADENGKAMLEVINDSRRGFDV